MPLCLSVLSFALLYVTGFSNLPFPSFLLPLLPSPPSFPSFLSFHYYYSRVGVFVSSNQRAVVVGIEGTARIDAYLFRGIFSWLQNLLGFDSRPFQYPCKTNEGKGEEGKGEEGKGEEGEGEEGGTSLCEEMARKYPKAQVFDGFDVPYDRVSDKASFLCMQRRHAPLLIISDTPPYPHHTPYPFAPFFPHRPFPLPSPSFPFLPSPSYFLRSKECELH